MLEGLQFFVGRNMAPNDSIIPESWICVGLLVYGLFYGRPYITALPVRPFPSSFVGCCDFQKAWFTRPLCWLLPSPGSEIYLSDAWDLS